MLLSNLVHRMRLLTRLVTCGILLVLSACEAPLVLDSVKESLDQVTRRTDNLQALARNKNNTIVAVGADGIALTFSTVTQQWSRQNFDGKPFVMDISACPDGTFVALDYSKRIWISSDGEQWSAKQIDSEEAPQAVTCGPGGVIWVVGGFSSIVSSADRGATWQFQTLNEDAHYTTVQFVDAKTAYITGEFGVVVRTENGGQSWESLTPLPDEFYPHATWFENDRTGWVVGLNGTVYYTNNGGDSWTKQATDTTFPLHGITRADDQLIAIGSNGTVLINKRDEWKSVDHDYSKRFYLRGITATADGLMVAGGAGALFPLSRDLLLASQLEQ